MALSLTLQCNPRPLEKRITKIIPSRTIGCPSFYVVELDWYLLAAIHLCSGRREKVTTEMELLTVTDDRQNDFPQLITPFPDPIDPALVIESTNEPPQKLRPIRRSTAEDPPSFIGEQMCAALKGEESSGFFGGADVSQQVGSGFLEERLGQKSAWFDLLDESSSSSEDDDDDDSLGNVKEPGSRKRKRKTKRKMETFLENLVMKMMEKQEQMHNQLIQMIEKREKERIMREEAWKQQEMERIKREEEIRAEETSRSIALISFIQNVLGQEFEVPQPLTVSCTQENGGGTEQENASNTNNRRWVESLDPNRRWPETEVQALIMLRTSLEHKFRSIGSKCSIWDEIAEGMRKMGFDRSAKKCKEKWENINKYFRRSMGNGKKNLENSKTRPYFRDLEVLYRNEFFNAGNPSNVSNSHEFAANSNFSNNHEFTAKSETG